MIHYIICKWKNKEEVTAPVESRIRELFSGADSIPGVEKAEIVKNAVEEGATLTLTGKHASGITRIAYRFVTGTDETAETTDVVVTDAKTLDVAIPANASCLEVYVTKGKGIVSKWAKYYFG